MPPVSRLDGEPVAAAVREAVADGVARLDRLGVTPTLGTILASDDPADERFMALKHEACEAVGIDSRDVRVESSAAGHRVPQAVGQLSADPAVHAVFVQTPLPEPVAIQKVRERVLPAKDVDCFHPVNLGRLVAGNPRFTPATPAAVLRLLKHYDIDTAGQDIVVVGRSAVIGRPLANLLIRDAESGNATVTICHSYTRDLAAKTREADIVMTAAAEPGLVDGSMLAAGSTVIDISANPRPGAGEPAVVGDVAFASAATVASAITPVPGGVGPVTIAMLLKNVVRAAERQTATGPGAAGPDT